MVKKSERNGGKQKGVMVMRGAWTAEEDSKLIECVRLHGDNKWSTLPLKAGLNRCGKSCRLRWLNYLRPGINRGNFSEEEEDFIIRLHNLIGNRWSLIAGRLKGRTDNDIKNHWNTHLSRRSLTINDLNIKLSSDLTSQSRTNFEANQDIINPFYGIDEDCSVVGNYEALDLTSKLSNQVLDMDSFLAFKLHQNELGGFTSDLGFEDSNTYGRYDYQDFHEVENGEVTDHVEFDEFDSFNDCSDSMINFIS